MKNFFYSISAFALGALLLTSCAKEKDKFDKILTDGEWKVESSKSSSLEIDNTDYVLTSETDVLITERRVTTLDLTQSTAVSYLERTENPGITEFGEETFVDNLETTYTFSKDGSYSKTEKKSRKSYAYRDQDGNPSSINYSEPTKTSTKSGYWSWGNTTNTKTLINIDGRPYEIKLEKNKVTIGFITSSSESIQLEDAGGNLYNYKLTESFNIETVLSK